VDVGRKKKQKIVLKKLRKNFFAFERKSNLTSRV